MQASADRDKIWLMNYVKLEDSLAQCLPSKT
jgi:hypothetical protein